MKSTNRSAIQVVLAMACFALLVGSGNRAHADTLLTFDDLPTTNNSATIPDSYGGANFTWSNFLYPYQCRVHAAGLLDRGRFWNPNRF
jgi:hypothetical protein